MKKIELKNTTKEEQKAFSLFLLLSALCVAELITNIMKEEKIKNENLN